MPTPTLHDPELCQALLRRLEDTLDRPMRFMEVCGTHTVSIFRGGLRTLLPEQVTHLTGPGCPVCVTHDREVAAFLKLAEQPNVIIATFGDLMRVPGPDGRSLKHAQADGARVSVIYSPLDALTLAADNPDATVVFLGVGFETTAPAVAATVLAAEQRKLDNFAVFSCHKLVPPALAALPAVALAFAGITKAAQMPFHTWLLGAMVAPTPTSALLHSSTMVKAGVFLLIKLSPIFLVCPVAAVMTILVGGLTFLLCSFMAISQTNAKRVLAYSTIANLGLIVACAGVGTPEAVWAATFLVLFHAVAKSLLYLCVGTAEPHIGRRDIEDMDLMFERMPRLARFMMAGIMIMFVAPFGMLIAKWGTLVSFADTGNVALILILGFGSAATFLFWAKWLGKLSGIAAHPLNVETTVHRSEWIALMVMAVLSMLCCVGLPVLSTFLVEPYIFDVFGVCSQGVSQANLWVAALLSAVVFVVLFGGLGSKQVKQVPVYLAGVSENNANRTFRNSLSGETMATSRNWYMEGVFGEPKITPVGVWATSIIIVVGFCAAIATLCGLL